MSAARQPRWRRRKDARPAEIVAAAFGVFAERGFAAARLDDIAARAGVSKAALYLYFETKEELFRAVVSEAVAPNLEAIEAAAAQHDGPIEEVIRFLVPSVARVAATSPLGGVVKMVIGESRNFPELARIWHDRLLARIIATISGLIAKAQARGEVRTGDPRIYAISLAGPIVLSVLWRETFAPVGVEPFDIEAVAAQHVETVLGGMLTRREAT